MKLFKSPDKLQTFGHNATIECRNLSAGYGEDMVLQDISFSLPQGAQVALIGPNGAGKSTLFKVLSGLLPLTKGQVLIHGKPIKTHKNCIAYIPQKEDVDWKFPVTVYDVVLMGRWSHKKWFWPVSSHDKVLVQQSLKDMQMWDFRDRPLAELSGGQQQRVFIARALCQEPHILIMDEPFTGVDSATQETTLELLKELDKRKVTVIVSTHDLQMAQQRFRQVMMLNHRMICFDTPEKSFTPQNIQTVFGGQTLHVGDNVVVDHCCGHDEGVPLGPF